MSQEKRNENTGWRNKLAEMETSSGTELALSESWKKLHLRLDKKTRPIITKWYWVAAACLIFIIMTATFLLRQDRNRAGQHIVNKGIPFLSPSVTENRTAETSSITSSVIIPKQINSNGKRGVNKVHRHIPRHLNLNLKTSDSEIQSPVNANIVSPEPAPMLGIVSKQAMPKKKLSVVHINELKSSYMEQEMFSRNPTRTRSVQFFYNEESIANFAPTDNISRDLIKIKISPSN